MAVGALNEKEGLSSVFVAGAGAAAPNDGVFPAAPNAGVAPAALNEGVEPAAPKAGAAGAAPPKPKVGAAAALSSVLAGAPSPAPPKEKVGAAEAGFSSALAGVVVDPPKPNPPNVGAAFASPAGVLVAPGTPKEGMVEVEVPRPNVLGVFVREGVLPPKPNEGIEVPSVFAAGAEKEGVVVLSALGGAPNEKEGAVFEDPASGLAPNANPPPLAPGVLAAPKAKPPPPPPVVLPVPTRKEKLSTHL